MTLNDVREMFFGLGNELFPMSFDNYLGATGRQVWGLQIQPDKRCFSVMFGAARDDDLDLFNSNFHDAIAGYKVGALSVFPSLSADADVFLLSKDALAWTSEDTLPIVLHELCHWYIDSGNQARLPIAITPADKHKGKALYNRTDFHNEQGTRHTLQFCEVLCALARRAVEKKKFSGKRDQLVASAMRFDLNGGLPM
jgi:hypothetical protein